MSDESLILQRWAIYASLIAAACTLIAPLIPALISMYRRHHDSKPAVVVHHYFLPSRLRAPSPFRSLSRWWILGLLLSALALAVAGQVIHFADLSEFETSRSIFLAKSWIFLVFGACWGLIAATARSLPLLRLLMALAVLSQLAVTLGVSSYRMSGKPYLDLGSVLFAPNLLVAMLFVIWATFEQFSSEGSRVLVWIIWVLLIWVQVLTAALMPFVLIALGWPAIIYYYKRSGALASGAVALAALLVGSLLALTVRPSILYTLDKFLSAPDIASYEASRWAKAFEMSHFVGPSVNPWRIFPTSGDWYAVALRDWGKLPAIMLVLVLALVSWLVVRISEGATIFVPLALSSRILAFAFAIQAAWSVLIQMQLLPVLSPAPPLLDGGLGDNMAWACALAFITVGAWDSKAGGNEVQVAAT